MGRAGSEEGRERRREKWGEGRNGEGEREAGGGGPERTMEQWNCRLLSPYPLGPGAASRGGVGESWEERSRLIHFIILKVPPFQASLDTGRRRLVPDLEQRT